MAKKSNLTKHLERSGSLGKMTDAEVVMAEAILSNIDIDRISGPFLKAIASQIGERVGKGLMNNRSLIYNAPSWGKGSVSPDSTASQYHYVGVDLGAAGKVRAMMESRRLEDLRRSRFDAQWNMYFDEKGNRKRLLPDSMYPTSIGNASGFSGKMTPEQKLAFLKGRAISGNISYLYRPSLNSITDESLSRFDPSQSPLIAQEMEEASIDAEVLRRIESGKARARSYNNQVRSNKYRRVSEEGKERRENRYRYLRLQASRRHEALQQFPWLKPLAKSNPIIAKNLPDIAKALKKGAKTPIIGHFIKHPYMAAASAVSGVIVSALKNAGKIASLSATADTLGVPTSRLLTAGYNLSAWGGSEKSLARALGGFSAKQGAMFSGFGGAKHLETLGAFGIDLRGSGAGGLLTNREMVNRVQKKIRELHSRGEYDRMLYLANSVGFDESMIKASLRGVNLSKEDPLAKLATSEPIEEVGAKWNRLVSHPYLEFGKAITEGGTLFNRIGPAMYLIELRHQARKLLRTHFATGNAVESASEYSSGNIEPDSSGPTSNVINIGGISLPNVTNAKEFFKELGKVASPTSFEFGKAVIEMFNPLKVN